MSLVNRLRSEKDLLILARRGDATALSQLYEEHGGNLLRLAARLMGNMPDAEDLLHDLFVGLPELLGRYEHRDSLGAWLNGVMAQMALGRLRRRRRRDGLLARQSIPVASEQDHWNSIDLERAIAALPDSLRSVFVLRHLEEYSHERIAALLGISTGAARVRYLRALKKLRAYLEPNR